MKMQFHLISTFSKDYYDEMVICQANGVYDLRKQIVV